jgi:hypothetical protein
MRSSTVVLVLCGVLLLAAIAWWSRRPSTPVAGGERAAAPQAATPGAGERSAVPGGVDEADAGGADAGDDPIGGPDPLRRRGREPWAVVDLDAVRRAMPDNLYWKMSAPTTDQDLVRWREEERDRWNVAYGKVLSNTATPDEIDAFYTHRERLSSDYIEFAGYLLANYGEKLPRRDVALLKLAIDMHLARLEEIPRQMSDALARHEAHEAARQEWLAEQRQFEAPTPPPSDER